MGLSGFLFFEMDHNPTYEMWDNKTLEENLGKDFVTLG